MTQPSRDRRLNIRLTQPEWDHIHKLSANTTCRSTSEYARKVLSQKPVKVFYRNQSFDALTEVRAPLLTQLEVIGGGFTRLLQVCTSAQQGDMQHLIAVHIINLRAYYESFTKITGEIKLHIEKLSNQCDPRSQPPEALPDH